jgi:hypothetical protein
MKIDENATHYEYGNGRFDLMTDEEVRTFTSSEISWINICLNELARRQAEDGIAPGAINSGGDAEVRHHIYELWARYPETDWRLESRTREETQA